MMKTLMAAAGLAVVLAGAAQAQPAQTRRGADTDGDRRVSLAEMQARHAERFARLDLNRDGLLVQDEVKAARQQLKADRQQARAAGQEQRSQRQERRAARLNTMFARRDLNRDGFLVESELGQRGGQRLARLDADRDGRLSRAELLGARHGARPPRTGAGRGAEGGGMFVRLDTNQDGSLTRAEFDAQLRGRFERLDSDRDGFITRDERRAARATRG
jgi:Ca2+-binding EF-hand superfamily protein